MLHYNTSQLPNARLLAPHHIPCFSYTGTALGYLYFILPFSSSVITVNYLPARLQCSLQGDLSASNSRSSTTQQELSTTLEQLKTLQAELAAFQQKISSLQEELSIAQKQVVQAQAEAKAAKDAAQATADQGSTCKRTLSKVGGSSGCAEHGACVFL
jgi:septal ring factor EnvC (AmiA/AmiB activator)